jgi:hypothetical protein
MKRHILFQGVDLKHQAIEGCREEFSLRLMCRCLKASPGDFYAWEERPASARRLDNQRLLCRVKQINTASQDAVVAPGMHEDLTGGEHKQNCASDGRLGASRLAAKGQTWQACKACVVRATAS